MSTQNISTLASAEAGTLRVIRRNGNVTEYDANRIMIAMKKAFLAVEGNDAIHADRIQKTVEQLTQQISERFMRRALVEGVIHIESIQDQVELALMRAGEQKVARAYVLYREARHQERLAQTIHVPDLVHAIKVTLPNGQQTPLDRQWLQRLIEQACTGIAEVSAQPILEDVQKNLFNGVTVKDIYKALAMSARTLVETEPNYSLVTARLLLQDIYDETSRALNVPPQSNSQPLSAWYAVCFKNFIAEGIKHELLHPHLQDFDLEALSRALHTERDQQFNYLGLQTLYDRYFIHHRGQRIELPQVFFMRVAMGLAHCEGPQRDEKAIEFYNLLSSFDFMSSTPTLFNAGTCRPQLSSCFLSTVPDDLDGIYSAIKDNALLSKYAGGLGNDWTPVRAMGAHIKGTNGKSLGVVPFLNVADATAVAVNQCFAPNTLIYTNRGIKPISDIKIGNLVLGISGTYRSVTNTFIYNQHDPMVSLQMKHAIDPIQVTAGHPFYVIRNVPMEQAVARTLNWLQKGKISCEWVEAGQLQRGDYIAQTIPTEIVPVANVSVEDARLYGILLGDGHLSKNGTQWGVSGNPTKDSHLEFVRTYLNLRGIHFWETQRNDDYLQIHWAAGRGAVRDGTTGCFIGSGSDILPFTYGDLYDAEGNKHIAPRLAHLPRPQTLAILQGLLETDGNISRGKEITFCSTSQNLAEGLRYQLLRLAIPAAGNKRKRKHDHTSQHCDGSASAFNCESIEYDVRIPAVAEIADLFHCKAVAKQNWLVYGNHLFTRLKKTIAITPFSFVYDLEVEGDESYMTTAGLAHNGGKRKGALCSYLETWHMDIEEFLELRKNTGDERRRTHDMNTANWIPDLFMKRVFEKQDWTLFSPDETRDLHELYGEAFEKAYLAYEQKAKEGKIRSRTISAVTLWRKMLGLLFETGHPWMTFKDPCNLRSPQQHAGVVHSSNLCTEITLNTSAAEIAVCNLGSINLVQHLKDGQLDIPKLAKTIKTAIRMLDNVIDINYYSVPQAKNSNFKHRPIGLGLMGFQDALYEQRIPYASPAAVEFADRCMEQISYYAILASCELAQERGSYDSFAGSLWSQGVLPIDSIKRLQAYRGKYLEQDQTQSLDWNSLRERVKLGMRNSNVMAIAPTATIANICNITQSIEPTYQNLFVKSNLSGEFTVINPYLVRDLKKIGLWDAAMVYDLKYYNGSLAAIERIPANLKQLYATAFEIEPRWLVECASRRQKWIDQAQSLNLYMAEPSGKKLDTLYRMAWLLGLKTTYYLRSMGATSTEKATIADGALNAVSLETAKACAIDDPDCEACQ